VKPDRRRLCSCGFLPSVLITGLLLYGGLWLIQYVQVTEAQQELGYVFSGFQR
jgi:hypothetical protein